MRRKIRWDSCLIQSSSLNIHGPRWYTNMERVTDIDSVHLMFWFLVAAILYANVTANVNVNCHRLILDDWLTSHERIDSLDRDWLPRLCDTMWWVVFVGKSLRGQRSEHRSWNSDCGLRSSRKVAKNWIDYKIRPYGKSEDWFLCAEFEKRRRRRGRSEALNKHPLLF